MAPGRDNGRISPVWDWAAQSLILKAPALFDGYFGAEHLGAPILPAPSAREPPSGASKPTVLLVGAIPTANRRRRPPTQLSSQDDASIPTPPPTQPSPPQPHGGHREESPNNS